MHRQQAKVKEEKRLQVGDYVYSMTIKLAEGEYFVREPGYNWVWLDYRFVLCFFVFKSVRLCFISYIYTRPCLGR
jgi:hypothetical protein